MDTNEGWDSYQKLVLFRLKQNHMATKEIAEKVDSIDRRLSHIEIRDKLRVGALSAIVSAAIALISHFL